MPSVLQNQRVLWKNHLHCKVNSFANLIVRHHSPKFTFYCSPKKRNRIDVVSYFLPPERKKIAEEYLLYDIIGVVGAVGGTLGLCIGFSIFGKSIAEYFIKEYILPKLFMFKVRF